MNMNEINAAAERVVQDNLALTADDYAEIEAAVEKVVPAGTDDTDKRRVRVRVRTMLEPDQED